MISLLRILEQVDVGAFYDWTGDFDGFKNSINSVTETSSEKLKTALSSKIKGKSVVVRSSKGYKQPVKDYTIKQVTNVEVNDFYSDWVVVIKNEFNKEFFLKPGFKIKILGASATAEPSSAQSPTEPTNTQQQQQQQQQPQLTNTPPQTPPTNQQNKPVVTKQPTG